MIWSSNVGVTWNMAKYGVKPALMHMHRAPIHAPPECLAADNFPRPWWVGGHFHITSMHDALNADQSHIHPCAPPSTTETGKLPTVTR